MKELLDLYIAFFRIGGLTFGGGLAMLPMLKYELIEKRNWVTEEEILDYFAIGQCTPGIIAVNTATFVGHKKRGLAGAIFSTLGMISPSVIIITLIALFMDQIISNPYVVHALNGIKVVICALLLNTLVAFVKKSVVSKMTAAIAVITFGLAMFSPVPTVLLVVAAATFGIIMYKAGRLDK
jgi:chromate transporter